jgi:hypothetical protein
MDDNINIRFNLGAQNLMIQCKKSDKIEDVFNKFCIKAQVKREDVKFYYNSTEFTYWGKTLDQLKVQNFFTFDVVTEKYVSGA